MITIDKSQCIHRNYRKNEKYYLHSRLIGATMVYVAIEDCPSSKGDVPFARDKEVAAGRKNPAVFIYTKDIVFVYLL